MLEHALRYAQKMHWRVFPCGRDKKPLIKEWQNKATTDEEQIKSWWQQWPDAGIALACGPESGVWVLDIDLPDGPDALASLQNGNGTLPATLEQQTGGGGKQLFYGWNGREVRNSAGKIGAGLDVRGVGGYVVLPPSIHPSGNAYAWTHKVHPVLAPSWLMDKLEHKDHAPRASPGTVSEYGNRALASEMTGLALASKGGRNDALNIAALRMGQLVAGGELPAIQVEVSLLGVAVSIGLSETEARATIASGMKRGMETPRTRKSNESNTSNESNGSNEKLYFSQKVTKSNAEVTEVTPERGRFNGNLSAAIRDYISENLGSFTNSDIDRELCLTHPADRAVRRKVLCLYGKEKIINKDRRAAGKWHILQADIDWIKVTDVRVSKFDMDLPLGLSDMVNIPPKCVCVLAGTSNAGKTAFLLEVLRLNLKKQYGKVYLMSEMGPSEYSSRISRMSDPESWDECIRSASISSGFDGPICHHNRDGLSVVDFLEDVGGEYFKIASDIRSIYDALGEGVAWIALQKHSQASVGRGGEGTTEKARLYLTIDMLIHQPNCTISAIKIVKAKDYTGKNPNGLEQHVRIVGGHKIEPVEQFGGWQYCNPQQRQKWVAQYEHMVARGLDSPADNGQEVVAKFMCQDGKYRYINRHNCDEWQASFERINVERELEGLSRWAEKKPLKVDYFQQLCGILVKKNNEEAEKHGQAPF